MSNKEPVSVAEAVSYIKDRLINDKLIMAEATEKLSWSFPRIRSRARTICKKLNGKFVSVERGVYILEPQDSPPSTATPLPLEAETLAASQENPNG